MGWRLKPRLGAPAGTTKPGRRRARTEPDPAREAAPRCARQRPQAGLHYLADHPRWNNRCQAEAAWALVVAGRLRCEPVSQPVVDFDEIVAAYRVIDEHPERRINLAVRFGAQ